MNEGFVPTPPTESPGSNVRLTPAKAAPERVPIDKLLTYAESRHGEPVSFYDKENLTPEEKQINRIYDDLAVHLTDQIEAFGTDPRARFNEDIVRGYVAVLDLMRGFAEGDVKLRFNQGAFAKQLQYGDEFYRFDAPEFATPAGSFQARVEIRPKLSMASQLRENSTDAEQRIRFEAVPTDPTIAVATQIRVDVRGGHVAYDFHAYHPEREIEENIIDDKAELLDQHGIHLEGLPYDPKRRRHHLLGSEIVDQAHIKELRPTYERMLRRFYERAKSLESSPIH